MDRPAYNSRGGGDDGGAAGSVRERGGGGWGQDVAWAAGDGWGDGEDGGAREGGGQTLVHETHAPKRISHIQFGLLNAEVRGGGGASCCPSSCPPAVYENNMPARTRYYMILVDAWYLLLGEYVRQPVRKRLGFLFALRRCVVVVMVAALCFYFMNTCCVLSACRRVLYPYDPYSTGSASSINSRNNMTSTTDASYG